ncbi:MAG: MFS transporter [Actinobacteria bacterium]|nr:MAG: MFS transporter [Actinomycetota bacterium]
MSQVVERFHTGRVVLLATVAALGGFLFGFDTAVINGAVDSMADSFGLNSALKGFTVSSALIGCMIGAFLAGRLADALGRVKVMLLASLMFTLSAIGSGLAFGTYDMIFWRLVGGLGVGAASVIAPAYIAEISPASIRGRMGSLQQLAIVTGIFVALLSDFGIAAAAGGSALNELWLGKEAWRWMFMAEAIPAVIYGVLALTVPESPRYLVRKGEDELAHKVMRTILIDGVDERIQEIKKTIATEVKVPFKAVLNKKGNNFLPIVWVGIALSVFQQFVGINVIFYYSTTLWRSVGWDEDKALLITVLTSVTNIVVTLIAISLIDRVGRKVLLLVGSIGMTVSLGVLAGIFATAPMIAGEGGKMIPDLSGTAGGTIALVCANLFVVFFGVSWGPVVWVLLGEIFNNNIRALALGIAAAAQWLANFLISTTFPSMADVGLWFAYGFYTLCAFLSLLFVWKFVPETKGVQLEDMEGVVS